MSVRSVLYVPGDKPVWLDRALEGAADALIADLEDAVAPAHKESARENIARWLARAGNTSKDLWVRINAVEANSVVDDLRSCVQQALRGVLLAKFGGASELELLEDALSSVERENGVPAGKTRVALLIESACGLRAIEKMEQSASSRLSVLHLGEVDLGADLGLRRGADEIEFLPARWHVVYASSLLGLEPPVGPPSTVLRDPETFRRSTELLARLGFGGRAAIHPDQAEVINDVFTPSAEEVRAASDVIDRFDHAVSLGTGALVDEEGRFIDLAVVRAARRVVELAKRS